VIPAPPPGRSGELPPPRPDVPGGPAGLVRVAWGWLEAIALYLVGYLLIANIVAGGIVFTIAGVDDPDGMEGSVGLAATLVVDVVFIAVRVVWLTKRHPGWVRALGWPPRGERLRAFGWGAGMGVLLYPAIAIAIGLPLSFLLEAISGEPATTPEQVPTDLSTAGKAVAVLVAVVAAPLMEEFFYRGVLFRAIRDHHGFWAGALLSALLFGVVHFVPAPWQDTVLLQSAMVFTGFAFAWIYERRGTILASIGAHVVFNVIGITLILGGGS
jgi:membrane protease YdiL (CAAX protease family)